MPWLQLRFCGERNPSHYRIGRGGAALAAFFLLATPCLPGLWKIPPQPPPWWALTTQPPSQQASVPQLLPQGIPQPTAASGGSGIRRQWVARSQSGLKTTAESQGLHGLGSKAEISPLGYTSCRLTPPLLAL